MDHCIQKEWIKA